MTKTEDAASWDNYWQGRTAADSGDALVGAGIETDVDLRMFWEGELSGFDANIPLLDLACGAGSVLRHADGLGFTNLTGADVSTGAIAALKEAVPGAIGVVAPADQTGLDAGAFTLIASQFGFEYSDTSKTVPEIARLLSPGGSFIAIVHKTGAAIESEVSAKRDEAKAIQDTGFIDAAKGLFKASMTASADAEFQSALDTFRPRQASLLEIARASGGLAGHLYGGTQDLYNRRMSYDLADINAWLDGMAGEISAYLGRMQGMMDAAQSEGDMAAIAKQFEAAGMSCAPAESFIADVTQEEIAWMLRAHKPG